MLNLSKSGGLDQGSTGDQSDRSENQSPAPSIRDDDENLSEDNISDVDEREAKDEGKFYEIQKKKRFLFEKNRFPMTLNKKFCFSFIKPQKCL